MIQRGRSVTGVPVYSADDPVDFLWRWMRLSWPAVFSGKFFDATGDTGGYWLCTATEIGVPKNVTTPRERNEAFVLSAECTVVALTHADNEDSTLNPSQVYSLVTRECTLVIEARMSYKQGAYSVLEFSVRGTTRETEPLARRYGGDFGFHVWKPGVR